ncbi:MAG: aminotransferase [Bosea sp. (in: a-proteobacteria)]|uniref:aminotransferase n=1 Tax=Bosea sp. (in: a-proteobacteria) TaxID=1871050 RepID=UPI0027334D96|nr:aminotransferase [Bosea sp. (in: a-proteobacteria)]MDP3257208.1 aminotransferase [Bosea sp. (in: a-proteobacteria)]MDP3317866.1 aminotransferase [Bosea sp. (in: a-proteobacteria)]
MNPIFSALPTSVFEVMSQLARETGAVNLGQGFPDDPGPLDVRRKAAEAVVDGWNQYPPMMGLPELRQATASHYKHWQGLDLDPGSEIMVTSGATEAIAGALMALVSPGDEVVLFEPMYDAYVPLVRRAGGIPKFVTLRPPHFSLSEDALAAAFSPRTKVVLFNNPLNPTATIFSPADLDLLADFCIRHDAVAICDEVWEHVVFDGRRHAPVLGRPDMRERTVKISSAGKIFSLTGWKVGLVMAAPPLMKVLAKAHQYITFTTPPNLQAAVAYGLGKEDGYFDGMRADFQRSRDRFARGLTGLGFSVLPSVGTYFLNVDIAPLGESDDVAFCRKLVLENGVAAIPVSAFYDQAAVKTVVRFCFAKRDATLDAALERLADLRRAGTAA